MKINRIITIIQWQRNKHDTADIINLKIIIMFPRIKGLVL